MRRWHWFGAALIAVGAALPLALLAAGAAGPPDGKGKPSGEPASIQLTPDPLRITCDGIEASTLTVTVFDDRGRPVADGTDVYFDVRFGFASPVETQTDKGEASTEVRLYDYALQYPDETAVVVYAGDLRASINVSCVDPGGGCEFSPPEHPMSPPCATPSPPSPPPCGPAFSPPCETPQPPLKPACEEHPTSAPDPEYQLSIDGGEQDGLITVAVGIADLGGGPYQAAQWAVCAADTVDLLDIAPANTAPMECAFEAWNGEWALLGCIDLTGSNLNHFGDVWELRYTCLTPGDVTFFLPTTGYKTFVTNSGGGSYAPISVRGATLTCTSAGPPTHTPTPTLTLDLCAPFVSPPCLTPTPQARGVLDLASTPTPETRGRGNTR